MTLKRSIPSIMCLLIAVLLSSCGRPEAKQGGMPIYITPYYNSDGLQINVGKFSGGLSATDSASVQMVASSMKTEWSELTPEAMYVLAIRLYDLGLKDDSVYWFYSAQYRAMLFKKLLDSTKVGSIGSKPFELGHAYASFQQLAGEYINGYAFGDLAKLANTVTTVQSEGKKLRSLKTIYPDVVFVDESKWAQLNAEVNSGMDSMLGYLKNNVEEIKAQRKAAGMEGKY